MLQKFYLFFSPFVRKLMNKVDYNALDVKMEKSKVSIIAASSSASDSRFRDCKFKPQLSHTTFMEIDHEMS